MNSVRSQPKSTGMFVARQQAYAQPFDAGYLVPSI